MLISFTLMTLVFDLGVILMKWEMKCSSLQEVKGLKAALLGTSTPM